MKILKRIKVYKGIRNGLLIKGGLLFLKSKIFKIPVLKYMDIALDYACNMKCDHCFAVTLKKKKEKLNIQDYKKVADDARNEGCLHFNLQGGEPLLIKNFEEYINAFSPKKNHISITTNGFLMTPEKINSLKISGVKQIIFSLDNMSPEIHDKFRGLQGSFKKVIESIKYVKEAGLGVSVNVTVSHNSLNQNDDQKKLFEWLHSEKIPYNPILACPVGAWEDKMDLLVTKSDTDYIENLRNTIGLAQRDIHASWVKTGCGAVAEQLYLTPYGDVMPCPFIHLSLGNVKEKSISEIWKNSISSGIFGHYSEKCWVAENIEFVKELNEICKQHKNDLPVPNHCEDSINFYKKHWGSLK